MGTTFPIWPGIKEGNVLFNNTFNTFVFIDVYAYTFIKNQGEQEM